MMMPFFAIYTRPIMPRRVLIVGFTGDGSSVNAVFVDDRQMGSANIRDFDVKEPPPVSEEMIDYFVARRALLRRAERGK